MEKSLNDKKSSKKKIKVHKCSSSSSSVTAACSRESLEDDYIPTAACDSKWVGLTILDRSSSTSQTSEAEDQLEEEKEIQVMDVDTEEELPLLILFPVLRERLPEKKSLSESTTDITKLLVGQKPNFPFLKKSKKLTPAQHGLPVVTEKPSEEKDDQELPKAHIKYISRDISKKNE